MSSEPNVETKVARLRYAGGEAFVAESQSGHAIVSSFAHNSLALSQTRQKASGICRRVC